MKFKLALLSTIAVLRRHRDDARAYAASIPTRVKVTTASTTSRLGEAAVALAAKLHAATTDEKRKTWLRRIREWRQSVRVDEFRLGLAKTASNWRVNVAKDKSGDTVGRVVEASTLPSVSFRALVADIAEKTGIAVEDIEAKMADAKSASSN